MIELEGLLMRLGDAGLESLEFSSPKGLLLLRTPHAAERAGDPPDTDPADGDGEVDLVTTLLIRSPAAGVVGGMLAEEGGEVRDTGARLGEVVTLMGGNPLRAPSGGRLLRWLVREGQAVGYRDPLALFEVS